MSGTLVDLKRLRLKACPKPFCCALNSSLALASRPGLSKRLHAGWAASKRHCRWLICATSHFARNDLSPVVQPIAVIMAVTRVRRRVLPRHPCTRDGDFRARGNERDPTASRFAVHRGPLTCWLDQFTRRGDVSVPMRARSGNFTALCAIGAFNSALRRENLIGTELALFHLLVLMKEERITSLAERWQQVAGW